jgi:hypothetical protein
VKKEPILSKFNNCFLASFVKDNADGLSAQVQSYGGSAMDVFYGNGMGVEIGLRSGDLCLCIAAAGESESYLVGFFDNNGRLAEEGEALLYSRSERGAEAYCSLYPDGKIALGNRDTELLAVIDSVFSILENLITTGSAATQSISPDQRAQVTVARQKLALLLRT